MHTRVISVRQAPAGWERNPDYVYIGRAGRGHEGYYGNPIALRNPRDPVERKDVLHRYFDWAVNRVHADPEFAQRVLDLHGKTLVCFCKPMACHGDALIEVINYMLREAQRANRQG